MNDLPTLVDPIKLAARLRIPYSEPGRSRDHHVRPGFVGVNCVFCGTTSGFHLAYSIDRGFWSCWRCGGHGTWSVVAAILRTKRPDVIGKVIAECAARPTRAQAAAQARLAEELAGIPGLRRLGRPHRAYLESRRFDPEYLADEWDVGGTRSGSGPWSWRVVAPIREASGRPVGYVGRSIDPDSPLRYRVTKAEESLIPPDRFLYGIDRVAGDAVVVVEGPADHWRLGAGSVATLGMNWRRAQAHLLRRFRRRFFVYDPEPRAQLRARRLAAYLAPFGGHSEVVSGFETDPGDMRDDDAAHLMRTLLKRFR